MTKIILTIIFTLCLSFSVFADPPDKTQEEPFFEHQKELAKEVGVILPGMTKQDVIDTYSELLPKKVWYTPEGLEVWYYKSPREQNIYFKGDIVERVEYLKNEKVEPLKEDNKQIDL